MNKKDKTIVAGSSCEFIELHRTFRLLSCDDEEDDTIDINQTLGLGPELCWPDLIKKHRLIILSAAGSGKTTEIRNTAHTLREKSKFAFFLRLEHIPKYFEDSFEVGTYEAFEDWLTSTEGGWLFLDSVDEAKLKTHSDFELAIRKLGRRIRTATNRANIVITGRTTAWRPRTDLAHCIKHLPYVVATQPECETQNEAHPQKQLQTKTETKGREEQSPFEIVALNDLTSDQVATFAKARGIADTKAFLDAVERADAWSFTSRPQDLEELTEFWNDKGRIGTRLQLMQNSIDRRLAERDQGRADARPLSVDRARKSSRLLAAATTLTQSSTIRVPDGADSTKGIAVQAVLTDWDEKDQATLLSRPIFDEAIYGAVRFHHRTVREYLAAEWFAKLLKRATSRRAIEALFFRNQYGLDIVVPTLRPILPWLAIYDDKIRERVNKIAPEIIFEGGDPSQLPVDFRSHILHKVCQQISEGTPPLSVGEQAAVERFATSELTDVVCTLLRRYKNNEDVEIFLLHMVWLGQLGGALPEAMEIALTPTAESYARIMAFRAIKAIGSNEDQDHVRQSFLAEASELKRRLLAELLEGAQPTEQTLLWLLACLEKSEPKERYSFDDLEEGIKNFADTANLGLLPRLISGLEKLLSLPPIVKPRYCEISEKFRWLIGPASKATERLILARHPTSLRFDTLSLLHKIAASISFRIHDLTAQFKSKELTELKDRLSKLVSTWKELNRALFWFDVERSRETIRENSTERLINFRSTLILGPFWRFEASDFQYVAGEIARQATLDNKLVALSLAFDLYISARRPQAWRIQLRKLVAGNKKLSDRLDTYLKPTEKSQTNFELEKLEKEMEREAENYLKISEKFHQDWNDHLQKNFKEIQETLHREPRKRLNVLLYLHDQIRGDKFTTMRYANYNWQALIAEYGEKIANLYRDGAVSLWRRYEPKIRSEGAPPNETTYEVIIGLNGLEIEANETDEWPKNLSISEVELACRYASFEINGFPKWFSKLFGAFPKVVGDFVLREISYELSLENLETPTSYIISHVCGLDQSAWNQISTNIYEVLKRTEPRNLANLDMLLKIVQGSNLPDDLIEALASKKCRVLRSLEHVARWFAVWTGVSPDPAIASIKAGIKKISDPSKQTLFVMTFAKHLSGARRNEVNVRQAFRTPKHLKTLYVLLHQYIRCEDDISRAGTGLYSPDLRDYAQDSRDSMFELLNEIPGKESFLTLMDLSKSHPVKESRPRVLLYAKKKAEQDADIEPWSPSQVKEFTDCLERTPNNHRELTELAALRLLDLKDDMEHGDSSIASVLREFKRETEMRRLIGWVLREKALGRYSVPQEEELADAKKPDLRFHGVGFDGPVPVELKLADNWTGPELFERLENQLCGDYLRDNRSNRGILVLVYRGDKHHWVVPDRGRVDFAGLSVALQDHWHRISSRFSNIEDIRVIGIDLMKRSS